MKVVNILTFNQARAVILLYWSTLVEAYVLTCLFTQVKSEMNMLVTASLCHNQRIGLMTMTQLYVVLN